MIVAADDLAVLRSHGREIVALQACHPRFFASHRYIVYARLMQIEPRARHRSARRRAPSPPPRSPPRRADRPQASLR